MTNARDKANIPVLNFQSKGIDDNADATAITINSSEQVGIGSTSPSTKLTINEGGEPPAEGMLLLQANSSQRQLRISPPSDSANGKIDYRGGNLTFQDDGTEVARFQGTTGFGIATSDPKEKLDSRGSAVFSGDHATATNAYGTAHGILLSSTSNLGKITAISNGSNDVKLELRGLDGGSANSNQLVLDGGTSNVGIGTSSPAATLHVDASGGANVQISRTSQGALYLESDGTNGNIRSTSSLTSARTLLRLMT